jgi:hypothetical protein
MIKVLNGIFKYSFGLIEGNNINEILVVKIHFLYACHDAIKFFLFGWLAFFDNASLIYNRFFSWLVASLLALACHLNIKLYLSDMRQLIRLAIFN